MTTKTLIAIELDDLSANAVLEKAKNVLGEEERFGVAHIIDPTSIAYSVDPTFTGKFHKRFEETAVRRAHERMTELLDRHALSGGVQHVRVGKVSKELEGLIAEHGYHQLVIGSHGWQGWRRLLGTHAATIVNRVPVNSWILSIPSADEAQA